MTLCRQVNRHKMIAPAPSAPGEGRESTFLYRARRKRSRPEGYAIFFFQSGRYGILPSTNLEVRLLVLSTTQPTLLTEGWLSGRKRFTANEVRCKSLQGFESLTLRRHQNQSESSGFVVSCARVRDSKDGAGTQDERSKCLSASQGRERYIFL